MRPTAPPGYAQRTARLTGPDGRPVDAVFAADDGTVLELAAAVGLDEQTAAGKAPAEVAGPGSRRPAR